MPSDSVPGAEIHVTGLCHGLSHCGQLMPQQSYFTEE